jgi:hypothetical protein
MIKRLIVSCLAAYTALMIGGCTPPKPEFNQTYLPNAAPGAPVERIELTEMLANKAAKNWHMSGSDIKALPLSLHWIGDDNLLFSILSKDRQKPLHSLLVIRRTGQIRVLEDAEQDALMSGVEKNILADNTGSWAAELAKFAVQATTTLAGLHGGMNIDGGSGEHFSGKLENNGYVLDINARVKRNKWSVFPSSYNCYYSIKNSRTGETLEGKAKIEKSGKKRESLENWLRSWKISPEGRFYLIRKTATFIDPENGGNTDCRLIEHYPYVSLDVSPSWDRIALLMTKKNEKTKQTDYWIEFYPFSYKNR